MTTQNDTPPQSAAPVAGHRSGRQGPWLAVAVAALALAGWQWFETRARLAEIAELFEFVSGSVDEILETSPQLFQVRASASNIFNLSQTLLDEASMLANGFENRYITLVNKKTIVTFLKTSMSKNVISLSSIILLE